MSIITIVILILIINNINGEENEMNNSFIPPLFDYCN